MTTSFVYDSLPSRVVFGVGAAHKLREEAERLALRRVLIVASREEKHLADELAAPLGGLVAGRFEDVVQHVPADKAEAAVASAAQCDADGVVTIGGGSATGFGKAISLARPTRHIAVPTTYAGSEMTPIWGMTREDRKETGRDPRVQPDVVIYDPALTLSLPPEVAGPSGMNALAHAVEATYAPGTNPVTYALALEAIRRLHAALPRVISRADDLEGRSEALLGAYLAACTLAVAGTALHHKACHVLGGMFDLNHGEMNAVLLPHALYYNTPAIPDAAADIARALGAKDAAAALFDLVEAIGAPTSLASIGMPEAGIDAAADEIVVAASGNVRPPDVASMKAMLRTAYSGWRPGAHGHPSVAR